MNDVVSCGREYDVIRQRHAPYRDLLMAASGAWFGGLVAVSSLFGGGDCGHQRGHVCGPDDREVTSYHVIHLSDVTSHM